MRSPISLPSIIPGVLMRARLFADFVLACIEVPCGHRRTGRELVRIAVVGAGGVGGGFGAALAKVGADVTFIARGAHLDAIKASGLKIQGGRGETQLLPTQATDNPAEV